MKSSRNVVFVIGIGCSLVAIIAVILLGVTVIKKAKQNNADALTPTPVAVEKATPSPEITREIVGPSETNIDNRPTIEMTSGPIVIIDPGHGGNDGGTNGNREERTDEGKHYWECNIALDISLLVKEKLQNAGVRVVMTREEDYFCGTVVERKEFADSIEDAVCYVSIHLNAADDKSITGTEVLYNDNVNSDSPVLAKYVLNGLLDKNGSRDRGLKVRDDLGVLKTQHPSCLVECEFLSADAKFPLLIDHDYQDLTAEGITNGIIKYLDYVGVME